MQPLTNKQIAVAGVVGALVLGGSVFLFGAQDITALENAYFKTHGRYLQIKLGNKLPPYEAGTVKEKVMGKEEEED